MHGGVGRCRSACLSASVEEADPNIFDHSQRAHRPDVSTTARKSFVPCLHKHHKCAVIKASWPIKVPLYGSKREAPLPRPRAITAL